MLKTVVMGLLIVSMMCTATASWAQDGEAPSEALIDGDVSAEGREAYRKKVAAMSPAKRKKTSLKKVESIKKIAASIQKMYQKENSEADKDIDKINCLNNQKITVNTLQKLSDSYYSKLVAAEDAGDISSVQNYYLAISLMDSQATEADSKAKLCRGKNDQVSTVVASNFVAPPEVVQIADPSRPDFFIPLPGIFDNVLDPTTFLPPTVDE